MVTHVVYIQRVSGQTHAYQIQLKCQTDRQTVGDVK